jgi:hypothetical protein
MFNILDSLHSRMKADQTESGNYTGFTRRREEKYERHAGLGQREEKRTEQ